MSAAQASGEPPNVLPRSPGFSCTAIASLIKTAPIGTPEAMPFADVRRSGEMPYFDAANGAPRRPMPVWISSKISIVPASRVRSRSTSRNDRVAARIPAMLWIGSRITAAISVKSNDARAASSFHGRREHGARNAR